MTMNMNTILKAMEGTVQMMADHRNAGARNPDGTIDVDKAQPAFGAKILADKMAGSMHEYLYGRTTIVYNTDRSPKRYTEGKLKGKVMTSRGKGQLDYLEEQKVKLAQQFEKDPECASPWTENLATQVGDLGELMDASVALRGYFINLYIEACAGTELGWKPYILRQVDDLNDPAKTAKGAVETDVETKARVAAAKERVEALLKRKVA